MGFRGRKPDPAAVKEAKGNPARRPIGADPVQAVAVETVTPPAWLQDEALAIWQRLAPRLLRMRLLSPADAPAFGRYCRDFARWLKMNRELDERGETYETDGPRGKMRRADPAFMVADRLGRQLLAFEDRFGMNPAERQRLFAARAGAPLPGDLFANKSAEEDDEQPKQRGPVGLLN